MIPEYTLNWDKLRSRVIIRDKGRCVLCGINKRLEVHHTREKALEENLITLCIVCHNNYAQSYSSFTNFKKRIREFNEFRLNPDNAEKVIEEKHLQLIQDINKRMEEWNKSYAGKRMPIKGKRVWVLKSKPLINYNPLKEKQMVLK